MNLEDWIVPEKDRVPYLQTIALIAKADGVVSVGATLGALGMGTLANFFKDSDEEFRIAIEVEKDYAKAQGIIKEQERKIRELKRKLSAMKKQADSDSAKVKQLEDVIERLAEAIKEKKVMAKAIK